MTTLAANAGRSYEGGERNDIPMVASDIIYQGAAVGIVSASGHARPLVALDLFAGFAEGKADNSLGAAAAIKVHVVSEGKIQLAVVGALITSLGARVYALDDNSFTLTATSATFIGFVQRFVSADVAIVKFDAFAYQVDLVV